MKARHLFLPLAVVLSALILWAASTSQAHRLSGKPKTDEGKLELAKAQVSHDRLMLRPPRYLAWFWFPPAALWHRPWLPRDVAYLRLLERRAVPLWLFNAFMCIHRGEGAWNSATGNGFYGGLQFDYGFISTYGADLLRSKGTADRWTPMEQIGVAIRAHRTRGFTPWPNTARRCGLL